MNTLQFMDKQIMDLSNSQHNNDFIDLMNPQEDDIGGSKKEEIEPSFDFQPIRPGGVSQQSNLDSNNVGGTRVWNSADSKTNTSGAGIRNYSSLDSIEPAKVILEKDHNVNNTALVSEIDRTMKKHADNLLHALDSVSARISQLESRTRHLENSMDDLKISVGNNLGSNDGKLRQLENIVREVHTGVQFIRDKQEILESQLHLAKMQVSKVEQQSEAQNTLQSDSLQQAVCAPLQSHLQIPPPLPPPIIQATPTLSPPNPPPAIVQPPRTPSNAPLPPPQQNLPTSLQHQNQFHSNQIPSSVPQREPFFPPPPVQTQEATNQQYQPPPPQQLQPPLPALPQQQYQPPPLPQYSQSPLPPQQHPSISAVNPSQPQPSLGGHHPEEAPFSPSQNYPPSLHQPSHLPSGNPPSQQFYGAPSLMYEPPSSRPNPGFSAAYSPPSGTNEPYPYGGSPSQYGGSSMKQQQLPSAVTQGTGSGYPHLPTARILPHALPTASGVGGSSGSAGTGNRVPMDDVVDKVTNMGFSREQVRATVRKLTESGQSVDLNVVLDKLMNDGEGGPPRGWFGR